MAGYIMISLILFSAKLFEAYLALKRFVSLVLGLGQHLFWLLITNNYTLIVSEYGVVVLIVLIVVLRKV